MSSVLWALSVYSAVMVLASVAAGLASARHANLAALVFAVPALASLPIFWCSPGGTAVVASMYGFQVLLRALDARVTFRVAPGVPPTLRSGVEYALYCLWHRTHPSEDRLVKRTSSRARAVRVARGVTLLATVLALWSVGGRAELWRHHPYLEDILVAAELALGLMGLVDIITFVAATFGLKHFLVDGIGPGFAWSSSLSVFWATTWNRPTAGVLQRGIFVPVGGRRARVRGVLLVFLACGVMHAAPILLGGEDRVAWAWLAVGTLAFFLIQAVGVLVDAAFRRRGGRPLFVAVFALSLPLYPAPLAIAFGIDSRPPESATLIVAARALVSR